MNAAEVNAEQAALMKRMAALAPSRWKRIFVNFEMQDADAGAVSDYIAFAVRKPAFGRIERVALELGADETAMFWRLCRYFMGKAGQQQLTMDLLIRDDGTFKNYLDYAPPTRLGGDLQAARRHLKYVDEDELLRQITD